MSACGPTSSGEEDVRKGAWTAEEDEKLRAYIEKHGTGHWRSVGRKAGELLAMDGWMHPYLTLHL